MTIAIRVARAGDRPALLDLWVEAWQATMPDIDFAARREWFDGHLDGLATAGATVLVACADADPVGFVTVDLATGALDQLAVAIARQGGGVATELVAAAKALSPGGLDLSVNAGNPRAVALYRRLGFTVTGDGCNPRSGLPVLTMAWRPLGRDPG